MQSTDAKTHNPSSVSALGEGGKTKLGTHIMAAPTQWPQAAGLKQRLQTDGGKKMAGRCSSSKI